MGNLVLKKEGVAHYVNYIRQRIKRKKNFLAYMVGQTGSGKSYSCLSIAEQLNPGFPIERVVFTGIELMELINSGTLKKGDVLIFEEAGVGLNNRNWQSVTNKMINYLLQTFRHQGLILFLNTPNTGNIDSACKKLFHAEFRTMDINLKEQKCILKPKLLQFSDDKNKFYKKWLRVITPEGVLPVQSWGVKKPSKRLIKLYEEKKLKFTRELNLDILRELKKVYKENKGELTGIQQGVLRLLEQGLTPPQIATEQGKTASCIRKTMELIKKKGYKLEPITENNKLVRYSIEKPFLEPET